MTIQLEGCHEMVISIIFVYKSTYTDLVIYAMLSVFGESRLL